jgi:hypothetical protein
VYVHASSLTLVERLGLQVSFLCSYSMFHLLLDWLKEQMNMVSFLILVYLTLDNQKLDFS